MSSDIEPGLRIVPGHWLPPFIEEHHIESCAVHSRSKGWIPAVTLRLVGSDGSGFVGTLTADDAVELVEIILAAAERADIDITAAVINGLKEADRG